MAAGTENDEEVDGGAAGRRVAWGMSEAPEEVENAEGG